MKSISVYDIDGFSEFGESCGIFQNSMSQSKFLLVTENCGFIHQQFTDLTAHRQTVLLKLIKITTRLSEHVGRC